MYTINQSFKLSNNAHKKMAEEEEEKEKQKQALLALTTTVNNSSTSNVLVEGYRRTAGLTAADGILQQNLRDLMEHGINMHAPDSFYLQLETTLLVDKKSNWKVYEDIERELECVTTRQGTYMNGTVDRDTVLFPCAVILRNSSYEPNTMNPAELQGYREKEKHEIASQSCLVCLTPRSGDLVKHMTCRDKVLFLHALVTKYLIPCYQQQQQQQQRLHEAAPSSQVDAFNNWNRDNLPLPVLCILMSLPRMYMPKGFFYNVELLCQPSICVPVVHHWNHFKKPESIQKNIEEDRVATPQSIVFGISGFMWLVYNLQKHGVSRFYMYGLWDRFAEHCELGESGWLTEMPQFKHLSLLPSETKSPLLCYVSTGEHTDFGLQLLSMERETSWNTIKPYAEMAFNVNKVYSEVLGSKSEEDDDQKEEMVDIESHVFDTDKLFSDEEEHQGSITAKKRRTRRTRNNNLTEAQACAAFFEEIKREAVLREELVDTTDNMIAYGDLVYLVRRKFAYIWPEVAAMSTQYSCRVSNYTLANFQYACATLLYAYRYDTLEQLLAKWSNPLRPQQEVACMVIERGGSCSCVVMENCISDNEREWMTKAATDDTDKERIAISYFTSFNREHTREDGFIVMDKKEHEYFVLQSYLCYADVLYLTESGATLLPITWPIIQLITKNTDHREKRLHCLALHLVQRMFRGDSIPSVHGYSCNGKIGDRVGRRCNIEFISFHSQVVLPLIMFDEISSICVTVAPLYFFICALLTVFFSPICNGGLIIQVPKELFAELENGIHKCVLCNKKNNRDKDILNPFDVRKGCLDASESGFVPVEANFINALFYHFIQTMARDIMPARSKKEAVELIDEEIGKVFKKLCQFFYKYYTVTYHGKNNNNNVTSSTRMDEKEHIIEKVYDGKTLPVREGATMLNVSFITSMSLPSPTIHNVNRNAMLIYTWGLFTFELMHMLNKNFADTTKLVDKIIKNTYSISTPETKSTKSQTTVFSIPFAVDSTSSSSFRYYSTTDAIPFQCPKNNALACTSALEYYLKRVHDRNLANGNDKQKQFMS